MLGAARDILQVSFGPDTSVLRRATSKVDFGEHLYKISADCGPPLDSHSSCTELFLAPWSTKLTKLNDLFSVSFTFKTCAQVKNIPFWASRATAEAQELPFLRRATPRETVVAFPVKKIKAGRHFIFWNYFYEDAFVIK